MVALDLVGEVLGQRRPLDEALDRHRAFADLEPRDRAFARLLVATVLRRLGQIDAAIRACLDKELTPKANQIRDVLRLGAAQILFLRTPAHAAVDATVGLARGRRQAGYKGLLNAVLRRLARQGVGLIAAQDAPRLNTPAWLWRSWTGAYGEAATRAIAEIHAREPPIDLAVKSHPEAWAEALGGTLLPGGAIRRPAGGAIADFPGYAEGAWWVQDAAAALPARLLGEVNGRTVLDLCAAPGGKTAQLAAAGARVVAVDRSAARVQRLADNLRRLGLAAQTVVADAEGWRPPRRVAQILLDAPCSATGTIRRHPDIAHLKSSADVARSVAVQDRLLDAAIDMLAPRGTLVYCTCSLEPEEGPARIAAALMRGAPVKRRPIRPAEIGGLAEAISAAGDLRTLPCQLAAAGGLDGFYAARLVRI
ncbi:MAG: RsmB/NOP family class I SAM-dependent RNA methyltransferase [Pseudomonadota bacterium]